MKKLAAMAVIPLFGGFLFAQETQTTTTTKTTTWNGTLVDAGCQITHTEKNETKTNPDQSVTSKSEHSEVTECPVTTTTSSFGLRTDEGKYIRFDQPSNTKIVEVVKTNKEWSRDLSDRKPIHVRVMGTPHGDVIVMESMR